MKLEIITKQETIPSFSPNAVAVKHIEYYPDMEAGVKAVEFFIRTGARYPGIDWIHQL